MVLISASCFKASVLIDPKILGIPSTKGNKWGLGLPRRPLVPRDPMMLYSLGCLGAIHANVIPLILLQSPNNSYFYSFIHHAARCLCVEELSPSLLYTTNFKEFLCPLASL